MFRHREKPGPGGARHTNLKIAAVVSTITIFLIVAAFYAAVAEASRASPATQPDGDGSGSCSLSVTSTADGLAGSGSLRSAVICANSNVGADTINVPAGTYTLALTGPGEDAAASGDLDVTDELTIIGAGVGQTTIDGGQSDRVFDNVGASSFTLKGATVTNGTAVDCAPAPGLGSCGGSVLTRGGTFVLDTAALRNSRTSHSGADGGAIFGSSLTGTVNIVNSTIHGNATYYGGAVSSSGALTIVGSTLSGNSAAYYGGAVYASGPVTIVNSTISGNSANNTGGGVLSFVDMRIYSSTITNNSGGGIDSYAGTTTVRNSIIAVQLSGSDCLGPITSAGFNLESSTTCGFVGSGDIQNTDPEMTALGDYGGPTQTHALSFRSPAIDEVPGQSCVDPQGAALLTDQRGATRPLGRACDIGAYEAAPRSRADFDGDGRTDPSVFRPSAGNWYLQRSTAGFFGINFGIATDIPVPADYDGDGKTDIAVARLNSNGMDPDFFIINSADNTFRYPVWGNPGDVPMPGDYDLDGRADVAVWRPSNGTWYIQHSTGNVSVITHGADGDKPYLMDTDGDFQANLVYFRPSAGTWVIKNQENSGTETIFFGLATDVPVPADYDGDGKDDIAVFRDGMWVIRKSSDGSVEFVPWGLAGDVPVPGDYDGDGRDDVAIYRDGVWHALRSNAGYFGLGFGLGSDIPAPKAYIP